MKANNIKGNNAISVENLGKDFLIPHRRGSSFFNRLQDYCLPKYQTITAVDNINFSVQEGERVAFIGPNGAGKSTTIKILTGIMQPSRGEVKIMGQTPAKDRHSLCFKIGAVFGHRSQLWFHLPVYETFHLLSAIYEIPSQDYQYRLNSLIKKFEIEPFLQKPVRQLSLGERMRCEVVASFLHKPSVLFSDEPTIGLDINAKSIIRDLVREESVQDGTTLLLTSHDTDDIEKVCDRVIIIDHGKLLLDDSLNDLKTRYIKKKVLTILAEEETLTWEKQNQHQPGINSADFIRELAMNAIVVSSQPNAAYSGVFKMFTFTALPVAFLSYLPIEYIRTGITHYLWISCLGTILFFILACMLFYLGLKRYESGNILSIRV